MKATKLTQEHKDKLLEMCKKLFPDKEFGFGGFYSSEVGAEYLGLDYLDVTHINNIVKYIDRDGSSKLCSNISINSLCFSKDDNNNICRADDYQEIYVEGIHWLEFLIFHIMPKINRSYTKFKETNPYSDCDISLEDYFSGSMRVLNEDGFHPIDWVYSKFKNEECEYEVVLGSQHSTDSCLAIKKDFIYDRIGIKEFKIESIGWQMLSKLWDVKSQKMKEDGRNDYNQSLLDNLWFNERLFNK